MSRLFVAPRPGACFKIQRGLVSMLKEALSSLRSGRVLRCFAGRGTAMFQLGAALVLLGFAVAGAGTAAAAAESVIISEFMASNKDTLRDGNGDPSDWIEIENTGETAVDLAGWHLTDDKLNLSKWTFPAMTL
ncbi:MAG: hypothetical protein DME25_19175, partial [Verrucomicrobia bacterium]